MKLKSITVLAALFIISVSVASAWPKSKKTINLREPTIVGSVTLQPGEYAIDWSGTAPDVQVSFSRDGRTMVTAPAALELAQNQKESIMTSRITQSGLCSLLEINFHKATLHFTRTDVGSGN